MDIPAQASPPPLSANSGAPEQAPGLSSAEVSKRLAEGGANTIAEVAARPIRRALSKLWAPVPWMLEVAILVQLSIGDYLEAGVVALLLLFNAALGFFQEARAQATLDALKSRLALVAAVRRDGRWSVVPADGLVQDDVVKLSLGTVVAADVRIAQGSILVDQSMLTGESLPTESGPGVEVYAGALVRRGEATGQVTATGARTKFGRTAELVRSAKGESSEQTAIMRVVRNLALFNGAVTILLVLYALLLRMPGVEVMPLIVVAVLSSIPVALPSMFTLAAAVGARALARCGVLPTSLSAVDEAAGIDILCCDKTGTLTRNELAVKSVHAMATFTEADVLALAATASSEGGRDPVDVAICAAAALRPTEVQPERTAFVPFDPQRKLSEATVRTTDGVTAQVVKGSFTAIRALTQPTTDDAAAVVAGMENTGYRVLAVATGPSSNLHLAGFIALSDPPRDDSSSLVAELSRLGVRTIMVTGDAPTTAKVVGDAIGITGKVYSGTPLPADIRADEFAIYAGVLPEDKYLLVQALQRSGHAVGMCGDGANDAPALRQAQMGIAVSSATDVAKSAAGIVLTEAGLGGIVASVREGRITFQRILSYTLRSLIPKVVQVLFLATGLILTSQAILTPLLMVLMMVIGDFLAMSTATDNVRPSPCPSTWKIGHITIAGVVMGMVDMGFCLACLATGKFVLGLDTLALRTLTVVTLVCAGQAIMYVSRERRHLWSSWPSRWMATSSVLDLGIVCLLAVNGILMTALPVAVVAGVFVAAVAFAVLLDSVKVLLYRRLAIA